MGETKPKPTTLTVRPMDERWPPSSVPIFDDGFWGLFDVDDDSRLPVFVIDRGDDHYEPARKNAEVMARRLETAWNSHAALVDALQLFVDRMASYGEWDDGCFYYNGKSASELQRPIEQAREALRAAGVAK